MNAELTLFAGSEAEKKRFRAWLAMKPTTGTMSTQEVLTLLEQANRFALPASENPFITAQAAATHAGAMDMLRQIQTLDKITDEGVEIAATYGAAEYMKRWGYQPRKEG